MVKIELDLIQPTKANCKFVDMKTSIDLAKIIQRWNLQSPKRRKNDKHMMIMPIDSFKNKSNFFSGPRFVSLRSHLFPTKTILN